MNIDDVLVPLDHLIRMRRIMLRLHMYDLAERSDISLSYCSQILHGKRNPSFFVATGRAVPNSLSCVITLCYLKARDYYRITREAKSGKGYVDFLFQPIRKGYPAIILELKCNGMQKKQ